MISQIDNDIQSFGGVNYVGPDKARCVSDGAIFLSSDLVMKAVKLFGINTDSIMDATATFLQYVVIRCLHVVALKHSQCCCCSGRDE